MKILYVTTVCGTLNFFPKHFAMLQAQGYQIEVACNCQGTVPPICEEMGLIVHDIPFSRSPLARSNFRALKQLKALCKEGEYDIVHTHTPNASACVRLACRKLRKQGKTKVFYTAHGFHFYAGAPLKNWLIYYTIEKFCARYTDVLITINQEDYARAKKKMKAKEVVYVPGVGIDLQKFGKTAVDRLAKREELGIPADAIVLLSVGELNENKNHETVIRAIAGKEVYYLIAGVGGKKEALQALAKEVGMQDRVKLLGFRTDVLELYGAADALVFPSYREGLSVALMEAMACGLPCVVSKIRGNTDLIDENGGALFDPHSVDACRAAIDAVLAKDKAELGSYNQEKVKFFSSDAVLAQMKEIYGAEESQKIPAEV